MKTTIELPAPLMARAKKLAARDSTTLRELIEAGLHHVLRERSKGREKFSLRDVRAKGKGLSKSFRDASWDTIREASYEGRGG